MNIFYRWEGLEFGRGGGRNRMQWIKCLCPPKFMCWHPDPSNVMVFWDVAFGRWLAHESRAQMNRLVFLSKRPQRAFLSFVPCQGHSWKMFIWEPGSGFSPHSKSAGLLTLDCSPSCEKQVSVVSKPPRLWYCVIAAHMQQDSCKRNMGANVERGLWLPAASYFQIDTGFWSGICTLFGTVICFRGS